MSHNIIILTGAIQTGKTTLLKQFCSNKGNVAGILTPIINGRRMFYNIGDKSFFEMEAQPEEQYLSIGKYLFSVTAFEKVSTILLTENNNECINYFIVDEIGPLEIKKRLGLFDVLQKIISTDFKFTLILVIRENLVAEAVALLQLKNPVICNTKEFEKKFQLR